MDISVKQVFTVFIGLLVMVLGINALKDNLSTQGKKAENISTVQYNDYSDDLKEIGLTAKKENKPIIPQTIYHLKKGNYINFDYKSIMAYDYKGNQIPKENIACEGTINGKQEGVYILRYRVNDGKNYLSCKVGIIIEGDDSDVLIKDYDGGKL